jgi:DNA-binding HxlR family transcriptional regulator
MSPNTIGPLSTIGRALAELADSWTLLILQRAFLGVRRFAGWRDALGISDSVLAGRLREMTAACLLEARPYREGGRTRSEYRLTPRGLDLWSLLVAIWWWERNWVPREVPLPELWHGEHPCPVALVCGGCGAEVTARDTVTEQLVPSFAGSLPRLHPRRSRGALPADPLSTFPGASEVIGDRWGTVVIASALLGARTFAEFSRELSVSPDVLSDRLRRFVAVDVLAPDEGGYRLTDKGRATFPIMALVVAWAERWLGPEGHPSALRITHRACGAVLDPRLACVTCGELLERTAVRFAPADPPPTGESPFR